MWGGFAGERVRSVAYPANPDNFAGGATPIARFFKS